MKAAVLTLIIGSITMNCIGQQTMKPMKNNNVNPLLCDPVTGVCQTPEHNNVHEDAERSKVESKEKPLKVIYFTDPICSSCWGIEPQLRKLKLEYGDMLEFEYRMGGLLPDWRYNSGGISKPSDVAHHWDEVSAYYDMPIDGDVWLEDPLQSSYPPSIAFKAAQMQGKENAVRFLRTLRELVFLQKKNIAKWENMEQAAKMAGLNVERLKTDYEGTAMALFEEDLALAKQLGVRGFPTVFLADGSGNQLKIYGSKPYKTYTDAIATLMPDAQKNGYERDWKHLFSIYPSLTSKEFSELSEIPRNEVDAYLARLKNEGLLDSISTKNGVLWRRSLSR